MKRALPITVSVVALIAAGALIGPSFIDWNKYKPQIVEQAKNAAGYDVTIDGDIRLSVLPLPQLKIEGLKVAAPRGTAYNLLTMKQANVSVKLLPLISGDIKIDTVRLVNPVVALETLPDGTGSWMSDKLLSGQKEVAAAGGQNGGQKADAPSVSLDRLIVSDGRVSYLNRQTGKEQSAEKINLTLSADSLSGPFKAGGSLVYAGKTVEIDAKTERAVGDKKEIPADLKIALPEMNALVGFKGIIAPEPLEIQGKVDLKTDNLASVLALGGAQGSPALARKLAFSGLVTASGDTFQSEDMDVTFGDAKGKGTIKLFGLKEQRPVKFSGNVALDGVLNLDTLAPAKDKSKEPSVEEKVAKGQKLSGKAGLLPDSLSLPFPVDGTLQLTAEGVQSGGALFKGVVVGLVKDGAAIDVTAKVMDMPGKTKAEGKAALRYVSASQSGEKGVTYADPSLSFSGSVASEQLPTLLRAFAGKGGDNKSLEIWKTGRFDLSGSVTPDAVKVSDGTIRLDQTSVGLSASYAPQGNGGRPDIMVDLTTDTVDLDHIQARLNGQNKQSVQKDAAKPSSPADIKKAMEPVRSFNLPYNLTFDVSAQKAIFNAQQITGIRIKGKASGSSLNLEVASAQDYMGAAASLRGSVGDLSSLSAIDLSFYGKTGNLKALMRSLQVDGSKLPQSISGAEANIAAKGQADNLSFDAKIAALDGELNASGIATGLLDKPAFSNLTIGAKHPNLVKAIQIVNPQFTGGTGLERPFSFNAKAVQNGNVYDLSGMKASLGTTSLDGDLKVATGGAKPSISGAIKAGDLPLDDLLGAKGSAVPKSVSSASGVGGGSDGKWSRTPIETGWMHTMDLDVGLAARSITYGGWNFQNPETRVTLKDGNLGVDNLQSGLFGGTASLNAKVQDPADTKLPLSIVVDSKMADVALEPLMYALSGSRTLKASGDVSLNFNVQTTGLSSHALVSALQGKANVNGKSVVMKGFDLAQIGLAFVDTGKPMDRLNSIVGGAVNGGETRFDTIDGVYDITDGIVRISSMAMDGPSANIVSKGTVSLPAWVIDTIHTITFKQAKDAGAFDVAIKGSLSNPGNTFGRGLFNDVLTRRAQAKIQEKLGETIQDKLGSDITDKLQGLGILPQQKQPAPAAIPTPAPATETAPAPVAEPDAAVPQAAPAQQEQQKPKSLEDQIKDDPAAAVQGILGVFGR